MLGRLFRPTCLCYQPVYYKFSAGVNIGNATEICRNGVVNHPSEFAVQDREAEMSAEL